MWAGRHAFSVVPPRVGAGLDRDEAVAAVRPGQCPACAGEVRVERRGMPVAVVRVAAGRVRLPDLEQRVRDGTPVVVEHAARDDDPLAEWLAPVALGQVGVGRRDRVLAEHGSCQRVQFLGHRQQHARRRSRHRRAVLRMEVRRIDVRHRSSRVVSARSAVSSAPVGAAVRSRSSATCMVRAGRLARGVRLDAGVDRGQRQLAGRRREARARRGQ